MKVGKKCRDKKSVLSNDEMPIITPLPPARTPSEAPRFTSPLSNVMARAGQKLRLECAVRGLPHPELTWLHNDKPVKDGVDAKVSTVRELSSIV